MTLMQSDIVSIPLTSFVLSETPMQVARRKERTQEEIEELAGTIKRVGLIHPIVARIVRDARQPTSAPVMYEIVAGEGRYLAAQAAGFPEIRADVRNLTDEQVDEIQIIENLQRKGLHELIEAMGYEQLMKRGQTVEEIAAKVGKSKRTVYVRLQLLNLGAEAREAFYRGELTASTALLLARIPDQKLQQEACQSIVEGYGNGPLSFRAAAEHIEREYMLRLTDAPFDIKDEQLVPKAGSCSACPKRSGNNPDLFGDVKSADVCSDPACYELKCSAHQTQLLKRAKQERRRVITGDEAKKLVSYEGESFTSLNPSHVSLDDRCYEDRKHRTYREVLGDQAAPAILKTPKGKVLEVMERKTVSKLLRDAGVIKAQPSASSSRSTAPKAEDAKVTREKKLRARILKAIFDKAPVNDRYAILEYFLADAIKHSGAYVDHEVLGAIGWDNFNLDFPEKSLKKIDDLDLYRLLYVLPIAEDLDGYGKPTRLLARAKQLKIDVKKIEKEIADEEKAAKAAAPAAKTSKKKAARKAK